MNREDIPLDVLQKVTVFAGIDEETLLRLCEQCRLVSFKAGDIVVREGTAATEIYIVLSGKLKIVLNFDEEPLEIVELRPGHCVGEASVIGVQNHSATAVAEEDVRLLELRRTILMDISRYDKDLFSLLILNIARELARRLYHTDQLLLQMNRLEKRAGKK
ncbi:MAG: cyclic nucleotide-binding domain-containing protein [Chitinivibrionales bacterium]|nr:cyclic nucleotide-binding domain-containing protein [Chitinivibrionales bacterium]MBD3395618.1 cyclic nucleotide-binding domain-containing protein [Chitinivibrionales bacterium]